MDPTSQERDVRADAEVKTPFHHRKIRKGAIYFVICTVAGLTALYLMTQTPQTVEALVHMDARFFFVAVALAVVDACINAARYHLFLRRIKPGVPLWVSFRAHWANIFMGAVTPSQTAGGPAQIYMFYRGGISLSESTFVAVINFFFSVVFFLIATTFALFFLRANISQGLIRYLVRYGFAGFTCFLIVYSLALIRPDLLGRAIQVIADLIARTRRSWGEKVGQFSRRITSGINSYHASCKRFFRDEKPVLLAGFGLTAIMYINKFALAYFLMRGLGVEGGFLHMIAIQTVIMFVLYLAPTPGASGIAELSIAALMSSLIPGFLLPVFTVLYRFFILYLPALFGFVIVMAELKAHARESGSRAAAEPLRESTDPFNPAACAVSEDVSRGVGKNSIESERMMS